MPILRNLRAKRLALTVKTGRKVTATEIADRVGCTRSHYANVEAQRAVGSEELALLLAVVYECDSQEILPKDTKPVPSNPPKKQEPKTTGPRRREESDTKSPGRVQPESGAA